MTNQMPKKNDITNTLNNTLMILPSPPNLSYFWNFGSLLGFCLIVQIITGLLLAMNYTSSMSSSFWLLFKSMETQNMWFLRYLHMNMASLFFVCMYFHISRGIYYNSYLKIHVWYSGVMILILTMAAAFLGYVLPMNQMSFWGASVITNLFSEIPYIGQQVVSLIWGSSNVNNPTIMRFFSLHFVLPFIILMFIILHITFLHKATSNNPLGLKSNNMKIVFNYHFSMKDLLGIMIMLLLLMHIILYNPLILGDHENFNMADFMSTPHHIQPEWYFLFAYAILRSIPNKLGGVIALVMSILVLYTLPIMKKNMMKSSMFYPLKKIYFWTFIVAMFLLTWIGMRPVQEPYILAGQILTVYYFNFFATFNYLNK